MLHNGRIVWRGPAGEIDQSGNAYVDQFINGRADGPITTETFTGQARTPQRDAPRAPGRAPARDERAPPPP